MLMTTLRDNDVMVSGDVTAAAAAAAAL